MTVHYLIYNSVTLCGVLSQKHPSASQYSRHIIGNDSLFHILAKIRSFYAKLTLQSLKKFFHACSNANSQCSVHWTCPTASPSMTSNLACYNIILIDRSDPDPSNGVFLLNLSIWHYIKIFKSVILFMHTVLEILYDQGHIILNAIPPCVIVRLL